MKILPGEGSLLTALLAARASPFLKGDLDDTLLCPLQPTPVPLDSTSSMIVGSGSSSIPLEVLILEED